MMLMMVVVLVDRSIRHIPSFQWNGLDSVTFEGFKSIRTNTIDGFMTLIQTHSSTANEWLKSSSSLATLSSTLLVLAQVAPSELLTTEGDETGEWMVAFRSATTDDRLAQRRLDMAEALIGVTRCHVFDTTAIAEEELTK